MFNCRGGGWCVRCVKSVAVCCVCIVLTRILYFVVSIRGVYH